MDTVSKIIADAKAYRATAINDRAELVAGRKPINGMTPEEAIKATDETIAEFERVLRRYGQAF